MPPWISPPSVIPPYLTIVIIECDGDDDHIKAQCKKDMKNSHFDSPPLPMDSVVVLHKLLPPLDPFVRVIVPSSQVDHSGL